MTTATRLTVHTVVLLTVFADKVYHIPPLNIYTVLLYYIFILYSYYTVFILHISTSYISVFRTLSIFVAFVAFVLRLKSSVKILSFRFVF